MHALLDELGSAASAALVQSFALDGAPPAAVFVPSPRADLQCNAAMQLAKRLGRNRVVVAR